jgi:hypothetical protein
LREVKCPTKSGCARAIHNEETERREGEDWSAARDYVRSLQNMMAH